MAESKNTAVIRLVGDNEDLRKKLSDSERRVKGLERAVARGKKNTKGAFSPLAESALKSLGPLGKLTTKLHGTAKEMHAVGSQAKRTGRDVKGMEGQLGGLGGKFGKLGGLAKSMAGPLAAAGAAVAGLAAAGELLGSSIDKLKTLAAATGKLSRETGMNAETSSAWIGVAQRMGLTSDQLSQSFGILSKKLSSDSKQVTQVLDDLGVSTSALQSGNMDAILSSIADGFAQMPDGIQKTNAALTLFGRGGKALIPVLNKGGGGIADLKQEMKDLGLTIDGKTLKQTRELTKSQRTLNQVFDGLQIQLATKVIPVLSDGAKKFTEFVKAIRTGKTQPGSFADKVSGAGGTINSAVGFMKRNFSSLKRAVAIQFPFMANAAKFVSAVFNGEFGKSAKSIAKFVSGIVRAIGGRVGAVANAAGRFARAAWRSLTGGLRGLPAWAGKAFNDVVRSVARRIGAVFNTGVRFGRGLRTGLVRGLGNVWGAIARAINGAMNGMKRAINWVIDKANAVLRRIPDIAKSKLGIPKSIPRMAQGAMVTRATVAMIGEAGPEAIIPLSPSKRARGRDLYAQAGKALGVGGGGNQITFNVTNNGGDLDERVLASKLAWQLQTRGI